MRSLQVVGRGLRLLAGGCGRWWWALPRGRRGPVLVLAVAVALLLGLVPYGPLLAAGAVLAAAAVAGARDAGAAGGGPRRGEGGGARGGGRAGAAVSGALRGLTGWAGRRAAQEAAAGRLEKVYEALVPYFSVADDPSPEPLYVPGGAWDRCFPGVAWARDGRLARLRVVYPPFFPVGDPEYRARVERVLAGRAGLEREFRFRWDEEAGELEMTALEPLPAGVGAQRFVTGPGEVVLGFGDADVVGRTVPVRCGPGASGELVDAAPVVWRTGARSAEPHLLVTGAPGAGATTLLRSVALQALEGGEVLLVDGGGAGEFGCFAGRAGVVAVESEPVGAVAALQWAVRETERRLLAAGRGEGVGRALWIVVDRPGPLAHLARVRGLPDPVALLEVPLRYGRAGRVTVAVAEQVEGLEALGETVRACARARVVLGPVEGGAAAEVLGGVPEGRPSGWLPPGRGFARLGAGPVCRVQVPATPDPDDEGTEEPLRRAVLALLPERAGAARGASAARAGEGAAGRAGAAAPG